VRSRRSLLCAAKRTYTSAVWRRKSPHATLSFTSIRLCETAVYGNTIDSKLLATRPLPQSDASLCIDSSAPPLPRIGSIQRDDCATAPVAARPSPIRTRRTRAIAYYLCKVSHVRFRRGEALDFLSANDFDVKGTTCH
jgi:hypothetical protein